MVKKVTDYCLKAVAATALKVTSINANSTCWGYTHQPKLPKSANKLKKL